MIFDEELLQTKREIKNAKDELDLEYIDKAHRKEHWWASIFIVGLFYGLNGKIGRMFLCWLLSVVTLTIWAWWTIYTSYRDQKQFNEELDKCIYQRRRELKGESLVSEDTKAVNPA